MSCYVYYRYEGRQGQYRTGWRYKRFQLISASSNGWATLQVLELIERQIHERTNTLYFATFTGPRSYDEGEKVLARRRRNRDKRRRKNA